VHPREHVDHISMVSPQSSPVRQGPQGLVYGSTKRSTSTAAWRGLPAGHTARRPARESYPVHRTQRTMVPRI
jgi:hypothetical protein